MDTYMGVYLCPVGEDNGHIHGHVYGQVPVPSRRGQGPSPYRAVLSPAMITVSICGDVYAVMYYGEYITVSVYYGEYITVSILR